MSSLGSTLMSLDNRERVGKLFARADQPDKRQYCDNGSVDMDVTGQGDCMS